ncbi:nonribosomal siderophore peptide synthase Sid [Marssonina coronariae]|uniref:Nonribosomal siderophore peptide synthase Sid n=1 Tax=Diplocarpon coronariae TaxID=2795749 RepID=A0A218Z0C4_9HELO|nr:nonribosomal siderophore peptide synthase Sid [Marssonina coronariae]
MVVPHIELDVASEHSSSTSGSCDDLSPTDYPGAAAFASFSIDSPALADPSTPTGVREEYVLLAWLLVLARTRERNVTCAWAYKDRVVEHELVPGSLSVEEVMPVEARVEEVAAAVLKRLGDANARGLPRPACSPVSILLSTSTSAQDVESGSAEDAIQLELRFTGATLEIRPVRSPDTILPFTLSHYVASLVDTIKACLSNPDAGISSILGLTTSDLDAIWSWNHILPPLETFCMQDMISQRAREFPDKVAVHSWDGDLTYGQVDTYSTSAARSLRKGGVALRDVVPVCFEKSKWTVVAVLAVMKAGGTLAMMDPSLPLARLQNMAVQVGAKTMVSSRLQSDLGKKILPAGSCWVVEQVAFEALEKGEELPAVPSEALMYIIFTSGSTGTPKGVTISHETYTSSAIPRARGVGYNAESRVLDFASYAFDVSIDSMLLTLGNGGCLCIPSEEDRMNDINDVIRKMQVNYAGITPSVARILEPDVIASLSALGLGGEAASPRDVNLWGQVTRIVIGYGPCECTIGCTINGDTATGRDYISIGTGNGAAVWVVNPDDHEVLMPVGAVGELLVEGPIVGQGYLNDPEKTAASFIHDPPWLLAGHRGYPGRRGRLYKTGDIGKYDPDGSGGIVFVGRQDTQVKLRGQRVELSEIESRLKTRLPASTSVIAEVIVPLGAGGQPVLVAFVAKQSARDPDNTELSLVNLPADLRAIIAEADAELATVVPRYMVPSAYIPTNYIPVLISGKTDRKRLRQFGVTVDLQQLDQGPASAGSKATRELSDIEQRLRQAWSLALKVDMEGIRPDDNFFALGGDSVMAMRLVTLCRDQGLGLTVAGTFGHPSLSGMAGAIQVEDSQALAETLPFSLISQNVEEARLEASVACGSGLDAVEDIYPCTPTQESLFTFSIRSERAYIAQRVAIIPSSISLDAWKKAWEEIAAAIPILRTRLAQLQEPGLQQVVLRESIPWVSSTSLSQYLANDREDKMQLGQSLARYALVDDSNSAKRYMVWTLHHVLYDGWSEPLILQHVSNVLRGHPSEIRTQMRDFVRYCRETDESKMHEYWRQELKGAIGPQFPRLPSRDFLATPDTTIEHQANLDTNSGMPFTMATLIRGAWALVASQYTGSDDVVFGETLTGRDIHLPGVEGIVGPLNATIPVRIKVQRSASAESYLQAVQQALLDRVPWQHIGWQNIRKVSSDAQHACEAGTGLIVQPEPEYVGSELGFEHGDIVREALHFNPYPLMLACAIRKGGFRVCANFDSSLIEVAQMERMLAQLEMVCQQLIKGLDGKIGEISCLSEAELNAIWRANQVAPLSLDGSGKLRAATSITQGSIYPPAVVSWVCNPRNPSLLSPIGCVGELWLEGGFLSGDTIDSPAWLIAGSSEITGRRGKVQATGDLVQVRGDGSLTLVGRKEKSLAVQGHNVNPADLEGKFADYLPPAVRAAVVALDQPNAANEASDPKLLVVVEHQSSANDSVVLFSAEHEMDLGKFGIFETTVCATISAGLAAALKKLDKAIRDSLPSYMFPSAYIAVEHLPAENKKIDNLNELAASIPGELISQLQKSLEDSWSGSLEGSNLTTQEKILRSSWAEILGISPDQIEVDDNFFRLGGDSVLGMRLVANLRNQGHVLTVAEIFQHMRLKDAAKKLKVDQAPKEMAPVYRPFSALGCPKIEALLSEIQPKLANPGWKIQDVLPVTDSQVIDIKATIQPPRTSMQYTMLYFGHSVDREQLVRACNELVKTHEILRTVFVEHESKFFQVVVEALEIPVMLHKVDSDILEGYIADICTQEAELSFSLGTSFLSFIHVEGIDGTHCLIVGLSHAQYDGESLPRLLHDLETLYTESRVVDFEPFSSYVAYTRSEVVQATAVKYWSSLLDGSSLSVLPGSPIKPGDRSIFQTKSVDVSHRSPDITTANLLTAAWALLLARRLQETDVTFGGVTSGRSADMANVEKVMGPCYQLTPIRVPFQSGWSSLDLLRFVQQQSAESAAHDFLGFERILKRCTDWSSEAQSFNSVVHHQDWEDADSLPFAGGSCKVDILNPHGDAAYPLKVVSFVRNGVTCVGVVGSERDVVFVDSALDELAATVEELARGSQDLFLGSLIEARK